MSARPDVQGVFRHGGIGDNQAGRRRDGAAVRHANQGQDGVRRYRTEIVAENMIMLSGGGQQGGGDFTPAPNQTPVAPAQPAVPPSEPAVYPDEEIKVEDIPF